MRQNAEYTTLFAGLLLGMTLTGVAFASTATSPILGHAPTMLVVTENAAGASTRVTASQSLVVSGAGVQSPGLSRIALLAKQSATLAVVPSMLASAARFASNQDAANSVGFYVQGFTRKISKAVVGVMHTLDSHPIGAMFSFIQNVKVAGKQAQAIASEWVRPDGSYDYLGVKVSNTNSSILFAVYTEGEIASGLPSNWNLPNPGVFTWGVAATKLDPATGAVTMTMETINGSVWHTQSFLKNGGPLGAYGLYDEPQIATVSKQQVILNCQIDSATKVCSKYAPGQSVPNNSNISFDPNTGLKALISAQIQPLMNRYNANSAFVTYGRTVKPVYLSPNAAGVRKAVLAVDVTSRKAQLPSCFSSGGSAVFTNSGNIGWMLDYSFDEYLVQPNGSIQKIRNVDKHLISPTKRYQVRGSVTIPAGGSAASMLANKVVDPWGSGAVYSIYNDTVHGLPVSDYMPNPLPTVAMAYKNAGWVSTRIQGYAPIRANICTGALTIGGRYVSVPSGGSSVPVWITGAPHFNLSNTPHRIMRYGDYAHHFTFWLPTHENPEFINSHFAERFRTTTWRQLLGVKIIAPATRIFVPESSTCHSFRFVRFSRHRAFHKTCISRTITNAHYYLSKSTIIRPTIVTWTTHRRMYH